MRPKFLSALLSLGNPSLSGFLERTSLEFKTGFWQVGRCVLALLSPCNAGTLLGYALGRCRRVFPFRVTGLVPFPISSRVASEVPPRAVLLPVRPYLEGGLGHHTFPWGAGSPWKRLRGQRHPPSRAFPISTSWSPDFHSWIFHRLNIALVY